MNAAGHVKDLETHGRLARPRELVTYGLGLGRVVGPKAQGALSGPGRAESVHERGAWRGERDLDPTGRGLGA